MTTEERFQRIEENLMVITAKQARHAEIAADHDEWLRQHTMAIAQFRKQREADRAEQHERDRAIDERIDKLVSAIGELISRIPPENLKK